jgi:hypothetical protein
MSVGVTTGVYGVGKSYVVLMFGFNRLYIVSTVINSSYGINFLDNKEFQTPLVYTSPVAYDDIDQYILVDLQSSTYCRLLQDY